MKNADKWGISTERRVRTRKKRDREQAEDAGFVIAVDVCMFYNNYARGVCLFCSLFHHTHMHATMLSANKTPNDVQRSSFRQQLTH